MSVPDGVTWMWPVPLLTRRVPGARRINPPLVDLATRLRGQDGADDVPAWASEDDLHLRLRDEPALGELVRAIHAAVGEIAGQVNRSTWAELGVPGGHVDLVGLWMQASNRYARHDVHTHGNCSFSGVYYVQVDDEDTRVAEPDLGEANGLTRLHSPHLERLGGAHMDLGAAWLQDSHVDLAPEPGLLVVWPSFLAHQVLPYRGNLDRVVVSFNAVVIGAGGRGFGF